MTPHDRAPRSYTAAERWWWSNVYDAARLEWVGPLQGYYESDAALTADVATATLRSGCHGLPYLPEPGDLAELGVATAVDWADKGSTIWSETWGKGDKTLLMWSRKQRALYIVPGLEPGACNMPPKFEDNELLLTWTKGRRGGRCSAALPDLPRVALPVCNPGIAVSYTSDKFGPKGAKQDYIHHFDSKGVRVYMDRINNPRVVFIQGGKLRIEDHGISG